MTGVTLLHPGARVVVSSGPEARPSASTSRSARTSRSGPLLFLVMLVPFTLNGVAVRESFFVSFLGKLNVSADEAFAAGFVFFLVTIALALPGVAIWGFEAVRARPRTPTIGPRSRTSRVDALRCHRRRRHVQRHALDRAVPRRASRTTRRSWSTTAPPTGRSSSCESASRRRRSSSRRTRGSAPDSTAACGQLADARLLPLDQLRRLGRSCDAVERLARFADENPRVAVVGPRLRNLGRLDPALRPRLSDALAPRDRVPLPAQARAALASAQRLLRGRLRARPRAYEADFLMAACLLVRREATEEVGALRRALLHVQRGGGLVLPLPRGGLERRLLPRRRGRCTSAERAGRGSSIRCSASRFAATCASSPTTGG